MDMNRHAKPRVGHSHSHSYRQWHGECQPALSRKRVVVPIRTILTAFTYQGRAVSAEGERESADAYAGISGRERRDPGTRSFATF